MSQVHEVSEPQRDWSLFIEFGNTPLDEIATPRAVLDWLAAHGLLTEREALASARRLSPDSAQGRRLVERFHAAHRLVRRISQALDEQRPPSRTLVAELNGALREGVHYHALAANRDGTSYSYRQVGDRLDQARATIAGSLADFLVNGPTHRLRTCDNQACRWLFIDRSPAGRRRWCEMSSCGNRAKAARHRARLRTKATSSN